MAGFSKFYVIGGKGGFGGGDGVSPIELLVLVGDGNRQWLEPQYVDTSIAPLGRLRTLVPAEPNHPDSLLDACLAFCPHHFRNCPSLTEAELALQEVDRLDFDAAPEGIPGVWSKLREEARPLFATMHIWQADLKLLEWTATTHG